MALAPPRTRGWTVSNPLHHAPFGGSPAHAGMDLWASIEVFFIGWLPRARGDGP